MRMALLCFLFSIQAMGQGFSKKDFEEAIKQIKKSSYYKISDEEIYKAAIEGVLKGLEDKNKMGATPSREKINANALLNPRSQKELGDEMEGQISGIGVSLRYDEKEKDQYPVILKVLPQGGAASAGLKRGDKILKVSSKKISEFSDFRGLIYSIRGKVGSRVKLTLLRDGEVIEKSVPRKKISWDAIEVADFFDDHAYLKISMFNQKTVANLKKEIEGLKKEKLSRVVLDMRGNSGGLLDEGIEAMKLFARKGETVLTVEDASKRKKKYKASQDGAASHMKLVILVDEETKSMGEAFAGTLRDLRKAKLVGQKTCGKGTMEKMVKLPNRYSLKVTAGKLYTASGKAWDRLGLTPDIEVPKSSKAGGKDGVYQVGKALLN